MNEKKEGTGEDGNSSSSPAKKNNNRQLPWEREEQKGPDKTQYELEIAYDDQDSEIAHGQSRRRQRTSTNTSKAPGTVPFLVANSNSSSGNSGGAIILETGRQRAGSEDMQLSGLGALGGNGGRYFLIDVEKTKSELLRQEDTDSNFQITVQDQGPKQFSLGTLNSAGFKKFEIRGTYQLSNLLQELAIASEHGRKEIVLAEDRLNENPVQRLSRRIKYHMWDHLTRRMDSHGLEKICSDPKNRSKDKSNRVYVPYHDSFALNYYNQVRATKPHLNLVVERLPEQITPLYVKSINEHPGILALGLRQEVDPFGNEIIRGIPFVVPGGRFNEMYGWDSYFEALGLLKDDRVELARGMCENFWYELEHYGKILNANRSYYLTRSQPPFLPDMMTQIFPHLVIKPTWKAPQCSLWINRGIRAAIKELFGVWLARPRLDCSTGLCKYYPEGVGIPPETEPHHFDHIIKPFAVALNLDIATYVKLYQDGTILEPLLNEYFLHDRAVRESGHDTTYRFEGRCANLATVDLNSLICKYARDVSNLIKSHCEGSIQFKIRRGHEDCNLSSFKLWFSQYLEIGVDNMIGANCVWNSLWARGIVIMDPEVIYASGTVTTVELYENFDEDKHHFSVRLPAYVFASISEKYVELIEKYMWSPTAKLYFDFDCVAHKQSVYKSCTSLWPLWAGVPSVERAHELVPVALHYFKEEGGLVGGTEESRGPINADRPLRQWDFPFGWAPHQILAWQGLLNYSFHDEAQELVYRWLFSITKAFVEYNGVVPEKFDVANVSHLMSVEYGNVGTDFEYVAKEGFGWMNASYQIGLPLLSIKHKRLLGSLRDPNLVFPVRKI